MNTAILVKHEAEYTVWGNLEIATAAFEGLWKCSTDEVVERYARLSLSNPTITIKPSASASELMQKCCNSLSIPLAEGQITGLWFCIGNAEDLVEFDPAVFDFEKTNVSTVLSVIDSHEDVTAFFCVSKDAGELFRGMDKDLSYRIRPKENVSHKEPHVHVCYKHRDSCSIAIETGEVLAGSLPRRALRVAVERILDNRERLLRYWETGELGIYHNLNIQFGSETVSGI